MVQSIERVFDILEALALANDEVHLTQLQESLNLSPATVHRLLQALISRGYAAQDRQTKLYGPGPKLLEIAARAKENQRFKLSRVVLPCLQELTAETGETSNLVVRQDDEIVYVEQALSPQRVRMFTEVGHRAPLYCTGAGKAILSCLPPNELRDYLTGAKLHSRTSRTISTVHDLVRAVERIRGVGYSIDNEEFEVGVRCVAAPILDVDGRCAGAISISGPTQRMSLQHAQGLGPLVSHTAAKCSAQLGYHPPIGMAGGQTGR